MNTTKLVGFIQGAFYPIVMVLLAYVVENLGASGIFPIGVATIITGVLSVIENELAKRGKGALFGFADTLPTYSNY